MDGGAEDMRVLECDERLLNVGGSLSGCWVDERLAFFSERSFYWFLCFFFSFFSLFLVFIA